MYVLESSTNNRLQIAIFGGRLRNTLMSIAFSYSGMMRSISGPNT
jgi:hypothetical protein